MEQQEQTALQEQQELMVLVVMEVALQELVVVLETQHQLQVLMVVQV